MEIGLANMGNRMEKDGLEVDISRLKKVKSMERAVELMRNYNEDLYLEMAEAELGVVIYYDWEFEEVEDKPGYSKLVDKETEEEKAHNRKVYERSREIGEQEWNELWRILQGQDHREYQKISESLTEEERKDEDHYYKWFDGTGLRGWWD
jgi:nitric oxide synthase oxygenase domain/subunit